MTSQKLRIYCETVTTQAYLKSPFHYRRFISVKWRKSVVACATTQAE
jgi:hypothetical protein